MYPFYLQHLTINASIYTLVAVALDRYRGIMFPLKGGYSKFRAKMAAALIWALSITMAIPNLVVYHVSSDTFHRICNQTPDGLPGLDG